MILNTITSRWRVLSRHDLCSYESNRVKKGSYLRKAGPGRLDEKIKAITYLDIFALPKWFFDVVVHLDNVSIPFTSTISPSASLNHIVWNLITVDSPYIMMCDPTNPCTSSRYRVCICPVWFSTFVSYGYYRLKLRDFLICRYICKLIAATNIIPGTIYIPSPPPHPPHNWLPKPFRHTNSKTETTQQ